MNLTQTAKLRLIEIVASKDPVRFNGKTKATIDTLEGLRLVVVKPIVNHERKHRQFSYTWEADVTATPSGIKFVDALRQRKKFKSFQA